MRIKIDECLPHDLKAPLPALGHDVDSVFDEQLVGKPDAQVFEIANAESRVFITKNVELVDARHRPPGSNCGLILVRMDDADEQACSLALSKYSRSNRLRAGRGRRWSSPPTRYEYDGPELI